VPSDRVPLPPTSPGSEDARLLLPGDDSPTLPREGDSGDDRRSSCRAAEPELPAGIALAALTTLGLGAVLGPEAPLIALGGGLAVCAVRLAKRDTPERVGAVVASAGGFAAVTSLVLPGLPEFGRPNIAQFGWALAIGLLSSGQSQMGPLLTHSPAVGILGHEQQVDQATMSWSRRRRSSSRTFPENWPP